MDVEPTRSINTNHRPELASRIRNARNWVAGRMNWKFSTRALLAAGILAGSYFLATAIDPASVEVKPVVATFTPTSSPSFRESPIAINASPESKLKGRFEVGGNRVLWANKSNLKFNEDAGIDIFRQLNQMPEKHPEAQIKLVGDQGEDIKGRIARRTTLSLLEFIPYDPDKSDEDNRSFTIIKDNALTKSAIVVFNQKPKEDLTKTTTLIADSNFSYAVEACQVVINAESSSKRDEEDPIKTLFLQEGVCNSWGVAVASRKQNLTYDQYVKASSGIVFESGFRIQIEILSEAEYSAINQEAIFTAQ